MATVRDHVRRHRRDLSITYTLVVLENTFELLYPWAIGVAVDGLIDDHYVGLIVFIVMSLAHTALSVGRQRFDTRAFNRLYAEMASDLIESQRAEGVATTSVVARAALAGEYAEFLERDVDRGITAAFAVIGSLVMLFFYDTVLGLAAMLVAVPVSILNRRLVFRSRRIYRRLNDQSEQEVLVIEDGSSDEVQHHYRLLSKHWNRLSDAEATSWGIVEVIALALAAFALVRITHTITEVGTIFAVMAYVWAFIDGFDEVPTVLQRMSNLPDIRRRLDGPPPPVA